MEEVWLSPFGEKLRPIAALVAGQPNSSPVATRMQFTMNGIAGVRGSRRSHRHG